MGSLYRSEEMTLCQMFLQAEAAYACVSELGELGLVQFRDLNPDVNAFQRKFVNEVRRCEEMERKLRFLEKEIKKDGIPILDVGDNPDAPAPREMIDLEIMFEKLERDVKEINSNNESLNRNFLDLTELNQILRNTETFFEGVMPEATMSEEGGLLGEDAALKNISGASKQIKLGFVAGVILREKIPAFERLLWRACRGNVFLKLAEIEEPLEDPVTGDKVDKSVFIIFYQGEKLKTRVMKICEGFRATLYPCPEAAGDRKDMLQGVMSRVGELDVVIGQTKDHRSRVLVSAAKNIKTWFIKVRKIKAIYHTLNKLNIDVTQKCLIAECWCPVRDLDKIQMALRRGTERSGSSVPSILNRMETCEKPPTYNNTNKFTKVFQAIFDSYGVATYMEVNPAPFSIITFPFLFSLMFGDLGHAILMFTAALTVVIFEKRLMKLKNTGEIWDLFFDGRYIILLMGGFSMYAGLMYNDIFSKPLGTFGSAWFYDGSEIPHSLAFTAYNNTNYRGRPIIFGMDPIWLLSESKITFMNSFKMKISVIFGVLHMIFGLCLSLQNHRFKRDQISILCEFIPQLIFIISIFGYLIILIFYKWLVFKAETSGCAPSLLIGLINMFLLNYPDEPCSAVPFYSGQKGFQIFLLLISMMCVPWLLVMKPYLLYRKNKLGKKRIDINQLDGKLEDGMEGGNPIDCVVTDEFNLAEVIINQCIHTIEYCLGCISHTASYLRLWALSLAHAELSEVLWNMILQVGFKSVGYISIPIIFLGFGAWAFLTIAILILMEGLSAFLHTLRLHWVEFQSKFYHGEGYSFEPFSFAKITDQIRED